MRKLDINTIKESLNEITISFTGSLPVIAIKNVRQFIKVGEVILVLESLCDYLSEDNILVSRETLLKIDNIGKKLGVKQLYWQNIQTK